MKPLEKDWFDEKRALLESDEIQTFLARFFLVETLVVSVRRKHLQDTNRPVPSRIPLNVRGFENALMHFNIPTETVRTIFGTHETTTYRLLRNRIVHGANLKAMRHVKTNHTAILTTYDALIHAIIARFNP